MSVITIQPIAPSIWPDVWTNAVFAWLKNVSGGLLYITKSWLMSLGIILLLILLDRWLAEYERKKRGGDDDDILL